MGCNSRPRIDAGCFAFYISIEASQSVSPMMPDWNAFIRQLLGCEAEAAVVSELAAHLEEVCEEAREQGLTPTVAIERALQEVSDWRLLAAQIRRAKGEDFMNRRTHSLWVPALVTFFGASVSLATCQFFGLQPHMVWLGKAWVWLYWWWLATLPVFGAVGAYLSRRAHGTLPARLAASLFPSLIMLVVLCIILPWGLAIDGFDFLRLVGFGLGAITWVVIPGIASLLGALPFLFQLKPAKA